MINLVSFHFSFLGALAQKNISDLPVAKLNWTCLRFGGKKLISHIHQMEVFMGRHKKIERYKELDRRRKRREKRIKQRIKEAKAESKKS